MESTVKKWGNSLGFRVPKSFANQAGIIDGSLINISLKGEKIIITLIKQEEVSLQELLMKVTPKNIHQEIDTDSPIGKELW